MQVLMIYIEPAPYIMDLVRLIREHNPDVKLQVLYISGAVSQQWDSCLDDGVSTLLPENKWFAIGQIFSMIYGGTFDILHLAGWGHPLLFLSLIWGRLMRTSVCIESDTQLPYEIPAWKKIVKRFTYPWLFKLPNKFLPGGSIQKHFLQHYGVAESRIIKAQMTVDVTDIRQRVAVMQKTRDEMRAEMGYSEKGVIFIFVGRLEEFKGISFLLKAFMGLQQTCVSRPKLLVVGDGSCKKAVEKAEGESEHINYLGRLDYYGVIRSLAVADVAVIPSTFEPWGLVVNEAMAAGLPVIVSDRVGCVDDLVKDGLTGLVVPAKSVEALEKAMQFVLEDEDKRKEMGLNGRKLISRWTLEIEAEIVVKAWTEMIIR